MEKFVGLAQANLASSDAREDAPWYVKYGARGFGTIAGGLAMLMGALNTITSILDPLCMVLSIWQVVVGFFVIALEAPCCCFFVEHVSRVTQRVDTKPLYIKAAAYVIAPLPTLIACFGFATFFGSGMIIGAGVMYGFMALGKKAPREAMMATAAGGQMGNGPQPNVQNQSLVDDPEIWGASREEMARNAQTILPPQQNPSDKRILVEDPNPFSQPFRTPQPSYPDNNKSTTFGPPPPYTDLQASGVSNVPIGWDTSFAPPSSSVTNGGSTNVNPVPGNPYNPFQ